MCTWSFQPRRIIESPVEKLVLSSDQQLPACLDAHQVGSMSAREKKPCLLNKGRNVSQTIHFSISTFLSKCLSASSARKTQRSMPLHVRMLIQFAPICLYFLIENTQSSGWCLKRQPPYSAPTLCPPWSSPASLSWYLFSDESFASAVQIWSIFTKYWLT